MNSTHVSQPPSADDASSLPSSSERDKSKPLSEVKQGLKKAAQQLRTAASDTASQAREKAQQFASDRQQTAAQRISGYSSAIHDSAKSLEAEDPNIAYFTHGAADRLEKVAEYVRSCDLAKLRDDAETVARKHPALFFGGVFVAGLVLGNVLKASSSRGTSTHNGKDFDAGRDEARPETASSPGFAPSASAAEI